MAVASATAFPFAYGVFHTHPTFTTAVIAGGIELCGILAGIAPDIDRRHIPLLPHRGPTHSLLAAACAAFVAHTLMLPAYAMPMALAVGLCWCSHIAADLTNRVSVAVFWPLPWRVILPKKLTVRQFRPKKKGERGGFKATWGCRLEEGAATIGAGLFIAHQIIPTFL